MKRQVLKSSSKNKHDLSISVFRLFPASFSSWKNPCSPEPASKAVFNAILSTIWLLCLRLLSFFPPHTCVVNVILIYHDSLGSINFTMFSFIPLVLLI